MSDRRSDLVQQLAERFGAETIPSVARDELEVRVHACDLRPAVAGLRDAGARLLTVYGAAATSASPPSLRVVLEVPEGPLVVAGCALDRERPAIPSLAATCPAAAWPERELYDGLGFVPEGHPDLRPILPPPARDPRLRHAPDVIVEGDGVHDVHPGPFAAGIHEAMALAAAVAGDRLIHVDPGPRIKHRGALGLAAGRPLGHALALAERLCGTCSVAHAVALAMAAETLAHVEVPPRAASLRLILLELERLLAHGGTLATMLGAAGRDAAAERALGLLEPLRAAAEAATGSRHLRGVIRPGGVAVDLDAARRRALGRAVREQTGKLRALVAATLDGGLTESLGGIGVVSPEAAFDLDLVGPLARASGSRRDVRRDRPYLGYDETPLWVPLQVAGDALARLRVLDDEAQQSAALIEEALDTLRPGPGVSAPGALERRARACGLVESPRGSLLHVLHTGEDGGIAAWHVRAASAINLPALALAGAGATWAGFELTEASLGLCLACASG